MKNQKLLTVPEDLLPEDTRGYQGMFFTDASADELEKCANEWLKYSNLDSEGRLNLSQNATIGFGTTLRVSENKPKFEDLSELISQGFVTRVDCFGAGKLLNHIDDVIKALLSKKKRVMLLPLRKENDKPHNGPRTPCFG